MNTSPRSLSSSVPAPAPQVAGLGATPSPNSRRGAVFGVAACVLWGLLPVYWKTLRGVGALEVVSHRIVWAAVLGVLMLTAVRGWRGLARALRRPYTLRITCCCAVLLTLNWLLYIWAVNTGKVLQASLGYFINPLSSVALGTVVLGEQLRRLQHIAVALAGSGLIVLTLLYGEFPWVALGLTVCFSLYALLRKLSPLDSLQGMVMETLTVLPLGVAGMLFLPDRQFRAAHPQQAALLIGCGGITVVPLLLFASAARQVPMATLGLIQYLIPSVQLALAAFVYHEPITSAHGVALACIWVALTLYSIDALRQRKANRAQAKDKLRAAA